MAFPSQAATPAPTSRPTAHTVPAARHLVALAALLVATGASAQYKVVGPDGRITYTDRPPAQAARAPAAQAQPGSADAAATGNLPYAVRQAMSRFPVTLYAGRNCAPCDQARQALRARGVPFTEYSITTNADADALQARFGQLTVPTITVGGQVLHGYNSADLAADLTAAGYPAHADLPGYTWPAAAPMAPPTPVPAPAPPPRPAAPPPAPTPAPSGIQF